MARLYELLGEATGTGLIQPEERSAKERPKTLQVSSDYSSGGDSEVHSEE